MSDAKYYDRIKEIQVAETGLVVNQHLAKGWEILKVEKLGSTIIENVDGKYTLKTADKLVFVMGLRQDRSNPQQPTANTPPTSNTPATSNTSSTSKPSEKKAGSTCKYCGEPLEWMHEGGKNIPMNPDKSIHNCRSGNR